MMMITTDGVDGWFLMSVLMLVYYFSTTAALNNKFKFMFYALEFRSCWLIKLGDDSYVEMLFPNFMII